MSAPDSLPAGATSIVPPANADGAQGPLQDAAASNHAAAGGMTFVEMMFAVALGDTAAQVAKVMQVVQKSPQAVTEALEEVARALVHLLLVIIVIATSWVGWYHSSATKRYMEELKRIFASTFPSLLAFPFMMLLIDVFLVVCYFVLSEGAELPTNNPANQEVQLTASAQPETVWILVILVTYLIWNLVLLIHDWWYDSQIVSAAKRASRALTAIAAVVLAGGAFWFGREVADDCKVLMIDGALLAAVLTFRIQGVDEKGVLRKWDLFRGLGLAAITGCLIAAAQ